MRPEDPFYPHRVESYLDELATEELRRMQIENGIHAFLDAFADDNRVSYGINLTQEDPLKKGLQNGIVNFDNRDGSSNPGWTPNSIENEPHTVTYAAPYDSYARNDGLHVVTTAAEIHSTLSHEPIFAFLQTLRREPKLDAPLTLDELRNSYPALLGRQRSGSLSLYANNFDGSFQHWVEVDPATAESLVTVELGRYTQAAQARRPENTTDTPPTV
ncbi:MAG TPA: hypothetical protein VJ843_03120 [Candidatus Saccharimonadales bacterium]|nr:hypothetical protein [Candidatus Saccharimonadales bacterium]